jgi:hypothetical protein
LLLVLVKSFGFAGKGYDPITDYTGMKPLRAMVPLGGFFHFRFKNRKMGELNGSRRF